MKMWNGVGKVIILRDREVELFKLNRGYGELIQILNRERVGRIKDLPCEVISTVVNDDYIVEKKYLPGDRMGVLVADDDNSEVIKYLMVIENTNGDWTKNTKVDKFYERIIYSNPGDYYLGIMEQLEKLNSCYIDSNQMSIIEIEKCYVCLLYTSRCV